MIEGVELLTQDSVNTTPPLFGPDEPYYPAVNSFCRVSGPAQSGNVYPGFASQATLSGGLPAFRDREPVFVWEANGIKLQAGWYDCRLVGNYQGLPIYATNCCPVASSSSSGGK